MLQTVIDGLREVLGTPSVYVDGVLDYGLLSEYICGCVLVCITVLSVYKLLSKLFG